MKPWTEAEEARLRELYPNHSQRECAELFGRSPKAIGSRAKLLKVKRNCKHRPWTHAEKVILLRDYPSRSTKEIAAELGRHFVNVYQRAKLLGLKKTAEYMASPAACRLRPGDQVGKAHRFPKGHVPANKGLRRPGWSPGRMASTQFRKGERKGIAARNWRPLGTILPDSDGFLRIKIREGHKGEAYGFGNLRIWPLLNRHIWEQRNGPIPAGYIVKFKDGNRANCAYENLELISLADNMRRNSIHNLPPQLKQVIQLTGALKRKIRNREEKVNGQEHAAGS